MPSRLCSRQNGAALVLNISPSLIFDLFGPLFLNFFVHNKCVPTLEK